MLTEAHLWRVLRDELVGAFSGAKEKEQDGNMAEARKEAGLRKVISSTFEDARFDPTHRQPLRSLQQMRRLNTLNDPRSKILSRLWIRAVDVAPFHASSEKCLVCILDDKIRKR